MFCNLLNYWWKSIVLDEEEVFVTHGLIGYSIVEMSTCDIEYGFMALIICVVWLLTCSLREMLAFLWKACIIWNYLLSLLFIIPGLYIYIYTSLYKLPSVVHMIELTITYCFILAIFSVVDRVPDCIRILMLCSQTKFLCSQLRFQCKFQL